MYPGQNEAAPKSLGSVGGTPGLGGESEDSPVEKKLKNLRKRLRQIDDLKDKEAAGALLNADQLAKVAGRSDLEAEICKWELLGESGDLIKRAKNLKKKFRQVEELEERMENGDELNGDQQSKVEAKPSLVKEIAELEALIAKL